MFMNSLINTFGLFYTMIIFKLGLFLYLSYILLYKNKIFTIYNNNSLKIIYTILIMIYTHVVINNIVVILSI